MKNPILLLLLFCNLTLTSQSQTDTIQRYLLKPYVEPVLSAQDSLATILPFVGVIPPYIGDIPPWVIPYPYPYEPFPFIDWGTVTLYCVFVPTCGDSYHDNGELSSRIACKDSVLHGLATYWNTKGKKTSESNYVEGLLEGKSESWSNEGVKNMEVNYVNGKLHGKAEYWSTSGHKTSDYTYAYGRIFKQKSYGEYSKIESIEHFTYDSDGEQLLHGTCTYYSENDKEVNRYNKGKFEGLSQWYEDGVKVMEQDYEYDYLQDQKKWNANGKLIGHNTYSPTGDIEHLQEWNNDGVLVKEQFHHAGRCKGVWMSFYPPTNSRTLTYYMDNTILVELVKREIYSHDTLTQLQTYTNNSQSGTVFYYPNGQEQSRMTYQANGLSSFLAWNEEQQLTDSTTWQRHHFMGNGFYTKDDTLFAYEAADTLNILPIKRWAMIDGDTLRQDYVINSSDNRNQILQSNAYSKNESGQYVRSGLWSFYAGNNISHALTYANGDVTGRAVHYSNSNNQLLATEYGNYQQGSKFGKWTVITDSGSYFYTYDNNQLNGPFYQVNVFGDTLLSANYSDNQLDGCYVASTPNGHTLMTGFYTNNQKTGYWEYFNINGTITESGLYENGKRVGKWTQWYNTEKGKRKKRKVNAEDMPVG